MKIIKNTPTFFQLLENQNLELPEDLTAARKVVRNGSSRPSSYWGEYDFTEEDEERLGKHLATIYQGKITATFITCFAVRFLNMEEIKVEGGIS